LGLASKTTTTGATSTAPTKHRQSTGKSTGKARQNDKNGVSPENKPEIRTPSPSSNQCGSSLKRGNAASGKLRQTHLQLLSTVYCRALSLSLFTFHPLLFLQHFSASHLTSPHLTSTFLKPRCGRTCYFTWSPRVRVHVHVHVHAHAHAHTTTMSKLLSDAFI